MYTLGGLAELDEYTGTLSLQRLLPLYKGQLFSEPKGQDYYAEIKWVHIQPYGKLWLHHYTNPIHIK